MFSFLLQKVLKRSLTFAVVWGMAYPTLSGTVVVRNISLGNKLSEDAPMLTVARAEINPLWGSLFDEVIKVEEAELEDIKADISIEDPAKLLYCLNNLACLSTEEKQERRERLSSDADLDDASRRRLPLKLDVAAFTLRGGEILVRRKERALRLEVVQGEGRNVFLPLTNRKTELQFDAFLSSFEGRERVPLRAKLQWDAAEEVLDLAIYTRELPLALVRQVLPEVFPAESLITGELGGAIRLQYKSAAPAGARWRLRS